MQVSFGHLVDGIIAGTVFASSFLPALALVANLPGGHNVFPFDACCSVGIFSRHITARSKIDAVPRVFAATVKLGGLWRVEFPGDLLGLTEGLRRGRLYA